MLNCDYLIQGAGAMGMAAADELLRHTDAELLLVDRHHRPGGHWNDAYPFVRLHQPSATYGVNSRPLGQGQRDEVGLNRGLGELASGAEVLAYYDALMQERFLPSARVRWLPMHEVVAVAGGTARVRSLLTGRERELAVRRKHIVASALNTQVPATRPPAYAVDEGVACIPPNALPSVKTAPDGWVVVGGGKTAMDAVLWLLAQGVEPSAVRWIVPRDSWFIDRANAQPTPDFFMQSFGGVAAQLQAVVEATSMADLYHRLEAAGQLLRLDPTVEPSKYYCATVSRAELAQLRRVGHVLRLGHVRRIGREHIELDGGSVPTTAGTVHVDCSATAIPSSVKREPVFQGERVVLQMVRACQPVFSAALIAFVEASWPGAEHEARKNELCTVVPMPAPGLKWLELLAANMANQQRWTREEALAKWLVASRLDSFAGLARGITDDDPEAAGKRALLARIRELGGQARGKFAALMA
jgi:hypothetical protein